MKKYNILVTGVGAIIGYGIIKCLKKSKYKDNIRVIGIDIYSDAVGRNWCDHFQQGILARDDAFPAFLKEVIKSYKIDLVMPGIEQDIESITNHFHTFLNLDALFVLNKPELIRLCNDKWETFLFFKNEQVDMIKTYIDGKFDCLKDKLGLPFLLKPRRSYASKGIRKIESAADYYYWKNKLGNNFMAQQIVGTDESEYTVGAFGLGDGTHSDIIVLKRKLAVDGATAKAMVVHEPELEDYVKKLCRITKPIGPTNYQIRYHEGYYLLLEINPRISASTSIREAFGYNEAEMCIEYFLVGEIPHKRKMRSGSAVRYIEDFIKYDSYHC